MFALAQTAMATDPSEMFEVTKDGVNFRTGPSTDSGVLRIVDAGTNVMLIEHDPAGWSRVRINGTIGFIRSDFLTFPAAQGPVTFVTTAGVNLRDGQSTDANVVRTISVGTSVDVIAHDPEGWSSVSIGSVQGFVRSDYLALPIHGSAQQSNNTTSVAQAPTTLHTVGGVRLRAGPSTEANILRVLNTGTTVEVLEYDPNGWSRVRNNGTTGYIRSDLLGERPPGSRVNVELLTWAEARPLIRNGADIRVVDVRTGATFTIRSFSLGGHADVEPVTQSDTDTMFRIRDGRWSWAARPVWVTLGGRTIAASINGMPHAGSTISNNGMNGHLCLHFWGTITNNKGYERDLNNAVMEAFNAA